jgi:hypothetical protein
MNTRNPFVSIIWSRIGHVLPITFDGGPHLVRNIANGAWPEALSEPDVLAEFAATSIVRPSCIDVGIPHIVTHLVIDPRSTSDDK